VPGRPFRPIGNHGRCCRVEEAWVTGFSRPPRLEGPVGLALGRRLARGPPCASSERLVAHMYPFVRSVGVRCYFLTFHTRFLHTVFTARSKTGHEGWAKSY
jgi:hypothetical protein